MLAMLKATRVFVAVGLVVGGLAGALLFGLGIAAYFGAIDLGPDFASMNPLYLAILGFGLPLGAWLGWLRFNGLFDRAVASRGGAD